MNKAELTREIKNLRFHINSLTIMERSITDPLSRMEINTEIRACLHQIRFIKDVLLDIYVTEIKNAYPKADAIYEDKIIEVVGEETFIHLHSKGKIQLCGCINGRRLYVL